MACLRVEGGNCGVSELDAVGENDEQEGGKGEVWKASKGRHVSGGGVYERSVDRGSGM